MSPSPARGSVLRRAALALALAAGVAAATTPASLAVGPDGAEAALAKAPRSVHVDGQLTPIDDKGTYKLTGDLLATWYTLTADTYYQSDAMIIQKGLERIEGCLDLDGNEKCDDGGSGEFSSDYIYWATFDPKTGRLIEGECIHPVTAGKGVFAGLRGFLNAHDTPVGATGVIYTYEGELVLNAVKKETAVVPSGVSAGGSAGAVTALC